MELSLNVHTSVWELVIALFPFGSLTSQNDSFSVDVLCTLLCVTILIFVITLIFLPTDYNWPWAAGWTEEGRIQRIWNGEGIWEEGQIKSLVRGREKEGGNTFGGHQEKTCWASENAPSSKSWGRVQDCVVSCMLPYITKCYHTLPYATIHYHTLPYVTVCMVLSHSFVFARGGVYSLVEQVSSTPVCDIGVITWLVVCHMPL